MIYLFTKSCFSALFKNFAENQTISPEALMSELGIKKTKYYEILKHLDIKADKDSSGNIYLTFEKAEKVRAYLSENTQQTENDDSANNSIVKVDDSNLTTSTNNNLEEDIYIEPEEPTANLDLNKIIRQAAQLKARELATPDLAIRAIADRMTEDDLPEDLKEKLAAVREAVNPKWTPAELASKILAQHRSQKAQAQG